jgi:hypothetical protein
VNGSELFWSLVEPMFTDAAVTRSTMMGLPCVRYDGQFFASLDRASAGLIVKLPPDRVRELVASGAGQPFAPGGRVFSQWVLMPVADAEQWAALLEEARALAAGSRRSVS